MNVITKMPIIWLLVERGLTGTENQLAAIVQSLQALIPGLSVRWIRVERGSWLMPRLGADFFWDREDKRPDLVLAAGNLAVIPALLLKMRGVKAAFVQDPRWPWRGFFDRIYAPRHDRVAGGNVFETDATPSRFKPFGLAGETGVKTLLIGGGRKGRQGMLDVAALPQAGQWLITFSRRTPDTVKAQVKGSFPQAEIYDPALGGTNPYTDFLRRGEEIYVTDDSASMMSDAASTGRVVRIVPFLKPNGKLARLAAHLQAIGAVDSRNPAVLKDADKVASDIAVTLLNR